MMAPAPQLAPQKYQGSRAFEPWSALAKKVQLAVAMFPSWLPLFVHPLCLLYCTLLCISMILFLGMKVVHPYMVIVRFSHMDGMDKTVYEGVIRICSDASSNCGHDRSVTKQAAEFPLQR